MINKLQIITLIICALPIANTILLRFLRKNLSLTTLFNQSLPVFSLFCIAILSFSRESEAVILFSLIDKFTISFGFSSNALIFTAIVNIFWLLFVFYLQKFVSFSSAGAISFLENFLLIVTSLILLAASNNLFSIYIFYQVIVILFYQYSHKFLHKLEGKSCLYFSAIIYVESLILLLGVIYAYQQFGTFEIKIISQNITSLDKDNLYLFFLLLIAPTLLFAIFPFYLFYRKINLNPLIIFVLFFFLYFLSHGYLFLKFYFEIFNQIYISKTALTIFEVIFFVNIFAASIFLVFAKNLKSSFFYLFFQQLLLAIYSTILLLFFKYDSPLLSLISFAISFGIMVFSLSNILLFFDNAQKKKHSKIFFELQISVILFLIAIANLVAIIPAIGMQALFICISKIISEKLIISAIIYALNMFSILIFFIKIVFPLIQKNDEHEKFIKDEELAQRIDKNYYLIIPPIILSVSAFLIPIIMFFTK